MPPRKYIKKKKYTTSKRAARPAYKSRSKFSKGKTRGQFGITALRPPKPTIQRNYLPFGDSFMAKLPYKDTYVITNNTNQTSTKHTFFLNSLFDIDNTGIGHQPRQYDQISIFYQKYIVYGTKVTITFYDPSADGVTVGYRIHITDSQTSTDLKSYSQIAELQNVWSKPINNTGSQRLTKTIYVPSSVPFGITKQMYNTQTDLYGAKTTETPIRNVIFDVFSIDENGSSTSVKFTISTVQYCKLYAYIPASQS